MNFNFKILSDKKKGYQEERSNILATVFNHR